MKEAVIVSAVRTPVGKAPRGALRTTRPDELAATVIQNHPAWLANDALSSWVGPVNPGTANVAAGEYRYRTTFDLTGFNPTTAQIVINVAADNRLNSVLLNGASTGIAFVGFAGFSPNFTLNSGFIAGTNSLEFFTANDTTTPNPALPSSRPSPPNTWNVPR